MTVHDRERSLRCPSWRFPNEHRYFPYPGLCRFRVTCAAPGGLQGRPIPRRAHRPRVFRVFSDDERYLSLSDLYASARTERATAQTVKSRAVRVEARRDDAEQPALIVPELWSIMQPGRRAGGLFAGFAGAVGGHQPATWPCLP